MNYSEQVRQHFFHPLHVGLIEEANDDNCFTQHMGSAEQGAMITLQIKTNGKQLITHAGFKAYGDPSIIACGSWGTAQLLGKTLAQAQELTSAQFVDGLQLQDHQWTGALLMENAIKQVIKHKD